MVVLACLAWEAFEQMKILEPCLAEIGFSIFSVAQRQLYYSVYKLCGWQRGNVTQAFILSGTIELDDLEDVDV